MKTLLVYLALLVASTFALSGTNRMKRSTDDTLSTLVESLESTVEKAYSAINSSLTAVKDIENEFYTNLYSEISALQETVTTAITSAVETAETDISICVQSVNASATTLLEETVTSVVTCAEQIFVDIYSEIKEIVADAEELATLITTIKNDTESCNSEAVCLATLYIENAVTAGTDVVEIATLISEISSSVATLREQLIACATTSLANAALEIASKVVAVAACLVTS